MAVVDELFGSGRDLTSILEDIARLSVRLMLQTALEAEVDAFLGRARHRPSTSTARRPSGTPTSSAAPGPTHHTINRHQHGKGGA